MNVLFENLLGSLAFSAVFIATTLGGVLESRAGHHVLGRLTPYQDCRLCHGDDLQGGIGRSCYSCHGRVWPGGELAPLADVGGPYSGEAGNAVWFDGSGSADLDGAIVAYLWDFGDGSVDSNIQPRHTYASVGTYTVTLTVTDDNGNTDTANTVAEITGSTLNVPPLADAGGPYTGAGGIAVQFDGSGSIDVDGTIVSYEWDFGDGSSGTGPAPTHAYSEMGFFMVQLTVTDDGGATDTVNTAATVSLATNQPPDVDPGGPYSGVVDELVTLDASNTFDADGDTLIFIWDFGDGSLPSFPSENPVATHNYNKAGTYTAKVIVTDGALTPVIAEVAVTITEDSSGNPLPPADETWLVQIPLQGTEFTVSWADVEGMLWGQATHLDGRTSTVVGLLFNDMIMWADLSGAVFIGNVDQEAGTMRGIIFDGGNGDSIWLAERLQAP